MTSETEKPEIGAANDAYRAAIQAEANQVFTSISGGVNLKDAISHFRVGVKDARLARDSVLAALAEM